MKRLIAGAAFVAVLAAPATASAKPSKADRKEARTECKAALKAAGGRAELGSILGASKSRAFSVCVREQTADAKSERRQSARQAVRECRAERAMSDEDFAATHDNKTFNEHYGQKGRGIGKCVSKQRRANDREADREDAATTEAMSEAVARCKSDEETSTGRAFGRCVSRAMASEQGQRGQDQADQAPNGGDQGPSEHSADGRSNAPSPVPPTE